MATSKRPLEERIAFLIEEMPEGQEMDVRSVKGQYMSGIPIDMARKYGITDDSAVVWYDMDDYLLVKRKQE